MAGSYLNYPFDAELFVKAWGEEPDTVKTALLNSGVLVNDAVIANQVSADSNLYTIPFYNILNGDEVNYDGATDIPSTETSGDVQTGIVYGRAKAFTARNFVAELSGNDPMGHIASSVARYWQKKRQNRIIGLLNGVFDITNDSAWAKHTVDLSVAEGTKYAIEEATLNNVATETLGDNSSAFGVAIMHSTVANTLANLQLLEYWKQNDANGIQRPMNLASANGYLVVIDDGVPVDATVEGFPKYTTYLLGSGILRYAQARLDVPVETSRDPAKNGGQDTLYTRIRETIHPNGFSFKVPTSSWTESPTDAQLFNKSNWTRKFDAKAIPMARVITNG